MDQAIDYSVVAFGETESKDFPLILVFGRESNGSNKAIPGVSIYDETTSSGSSFWNRALTFMQRCAETNQHLRNLSIHKNAGPVLFTNAFPHPIPNSVLDKDHIRASIDLKSIDSHIEGVFGLDVVQRVRVVVFSTGPGERFEPARKLVKEVCSVKGITFVEVPYFANPYVTNSDIDQSISVVEKEKIKAVITKFL
ncbi:hypothetical protein [Microbulbifer sp. JMSA003]|uniref:hypothetical protein n=1 Tax=Microbulbifer sp. JMSA003 TaxID=3243369 RepID=UPI004039FDB2